MQYPKLSNKTLQIACGLLNCFGAFGWGTLLAALVNRSLPDAIIGLLQFLTPFLGYGQPGFARRVSCR